jgi:hypothetical protein
MKNQRQCQEVKEEVKLVPWKEAVIQRDGATCGRMTTTRATVLAVALLVAAATATLPFEQ